MKTLNRRHLLQALSATAAPPVLSTIYTPAFAQANYPNKPITLIVPQPAGGDADAFCRTLQMRMQEFLGQPIVIDNRGGAAGNIGTALGAKAAPDGYTMTFVNQGTMVFNHSLYPNPGFSNDQFAPVSHLASVDLVIIAHPSLPANSLRELLDAAKKSPGRFNYATAGSGSANHLAGEMLKAMSGTFITHIPYRGGGPALNGVLAGDVQLGVAFPLAASPHIRSGRLKALAVTGSTRAKVLPDVPTVAQSGVKDYAFSSWFGFVVPKGTSEAVVTRLNAASQHALKSPEVAERLLAGMTTPVGSSPQDLTRLVMMENTKWSKLIKDFNVKLD